MDVLENRDLDSWLERLISEKIADGGRIISIERSRFPHIGSYSCDRVAVVMNEGPQINLFLKDFSSSRLSKDHPGQRRMRELRVYKELLSKIDLGTPEFYGSMWNERANRYWMLIELVEGEVVKEIDIRNGVLAVEWLARMQRQILDQAGKFAQCDFLIEHDAAYFRSRADNARRDVAATAPEYAPSLERILDCYTGNIGLMTSQPRCLVHGGYIPWHILVDRSTEPARVCVVDWELAARGATLYDLAIFIDDAPIPLQETLSTAYRNAATEHGVPLLEPVLMQRTINCFRLHRIVDWLSRSVEKEFKAKKLGWLVQRAETIVDAVRHGA